MFDNDYVSWRLYEDHRAQLMEEARIRRLLPPSAQPGTAVWQRLAVKVGDLMISFGQGLRQAAGAPTDVI